MPHKRSAESAQHRIERGQTRRAGEPDPAPPPVRRTVVKRPGFKRRFGHRQVAPVRLLSRGELPEEVIPPEVEAALQHELDRVRPSSSSGHRDPIPPLPEWCATAPWRQPKPNSVGPNVELPVKRVSNSPPPWHAEDHGYSARPSVRLIEAEPQPPGSWESRAAALLAERPRSLSPSLSPLAEERRRVKSHFGARKIGEVDSGLYDRGLPARGDSESDSYYSYFREGSESEASVVNLRIMNHRGFQPPGTTTDRTT